MSVPQLPAELWEIVFEFYWTSCFFEETFSLEKYYQMLQEDNYKGVEILPNMFINQQHKNSYDKALPIRDEVIDEWEEEESIARQYKMNYGEPLPWDDCESANDNESF